MDKKFPLIFVIPVFNEARNIESVLAGLAAQARNMDWCAVVVDDGSRDGTAEILARQKTAFAERLNVVVHPANRGIAETLFDGYRDAAAQATEDALLICLEGDGTSDLKLIAPILELLQPRQFDLVIASRFIPGGGWVGFPWHRRLISRFGNYLLRKVCPYPRVTDFSIFYRGYRIDLVRNALNKHGRTAFQGGHFSANAAFLLHCLTGRPRVSEVANRYDYRCKQGASSFRTFKTIFGYIGLLPTIRRLGLRHICRTAGQSP